METHRDCIFHDWDTKSEGRLTLRMVLRQYSTPKYCTTYAELYDLFGGLWKCLTTIKLLVRKNDSMFFTVILALMLKEFYKVPV